MKTCKIENCERTTWARGWCLMHYKHWWRHGDVTVVKCAPNGDRSQHQLWSLYNNIKTRCLNENNQAFKDYGGRGITIDQRWLGIDGFTNFCKDMGERPEGYYIERVDNSKGYSPDNCEWATPKEQANNRRLRRDSPAYKSLVTAVLAGIGA